MGSSRQGRSTVGRRPAVGLLLGLLMLAVPTLVLASVPGTGFLEVCKAAAGPGVSGTFDFDVNGQTVTVPVGACSSAVEVPAGTVVVSEKAVLGMVVTDIAVSPGPRLISRDVAGRAATVAIAEGDVSTQTVVTFTNSFEVGQLKVCKVAGPGVSTGAVFDFTAGGRALTVPAGPAPGGFCALAGSFPAGTNLTVAETPRSGAEVTAIRVAPPNRAGVVNVAAGRASLTIGTGMTEATFTNSPTAIVTTTLPGVTTTTAPGAATTTTAPGAGSSTTTVPGGVTTTTAGGVGATTTVPGGGSTTTLPGGGGSSTTVPGGVTTTTAGGVGATTTIPGGSTTTVPGVGGSTTTVPGVGGSTTTVPGVGGSTTTLPGSGGSTTTVPGGTTTTTVGGVGATTTVPGGGGSSTTVPGGGSTTTLPGAGTSTTTAGLGPTTTRPGLTTSTTLPCVAETTMPTTTVPRTTTTAPGGSATTTTAPGGGTATTTTTVPSGGSATTSTVPMCASPGPGPGPGSGGAPRARGALSLTGADTLPVALFAASALLFGCTLLALSRSEGSVQPALRRITRVPRLPVGARRPGRQSTARRPGRQSTARRPGRQSTARLVPGAATDRRLARGDHVLAGRGQAPDLDDLEWILADPPMLAGSGPWPSPLGGGRSMGRDMGRRMTRRIVDAYRANRSNWPPPTDRGSGLAFPV